MRAAGGGASLPGSGAVRGDALSAKPPATRSVGAPCGAPTCAAVPHAHHAATPSSTCHHFHPRHLASSPGDHARHAAQARVPIPARVHTRWCSGSGGMSTRPTPRVGVNHAVLLSVYRPRASTRRRCAVAPPLCERWSRARCRPRPRAQGGIPTTTGSIGLGLKAGRQKLLSCFPPPHTVADCSTRGA